MNCKIKGYKISKNYTLLWNLIHDGYRISAWVLHDRNSNYKIWDIVEVKLKYKSEAYSIGTRGIGYEGFENTLVHFKFICKVNHLKFINPLK